MLVELFAELPLLHLAENTAPLRRLEGSNGPRRESSGPMAVPTRASKR